MQKHKNSYNERRLTTLPAVSALMKYFKVFANDLFQQGNDTCSFPCLFIYITTLPLYPHQ